VANGTYFPPPMDEDLELIGLATRRCESNVRSGSIASVLTMSEFMSASLIGRLGSSGFQTIRHHSADVARGARASLRNRHQGPSIMEFEDGVEQSLPRPCQDERQVQGGHTKLTSSIVPRGTSFHGLVEFEFSPIAFGYLRPSCYCGLSGPPETQCRQPKCGA